MWQGQMWQGQMWQGPPSSLTFAENVIHAEAGRKVDGPRPLAGAGVHPRLREPVAERLHVHLVLELSGRVDTEDTWGADDISEHMGGGQQERPTRSRQ